MRQVPREVLKTEAEGRGFQHLPKDLTNYIKCFVVFLGFFFFCVCVLLLLFCCCCFCCFFLFVFVCVCVCVCISAVGCCLMLSDWHTKTDTCPNSVDQDETARHEPSLQDPHCLPYQF